MTEQETKRYRIDALLAHGVQLFDDLEDEELKALGKSIGRGQLAVPVVLSEDGILFEGHQRLKAMLGLGRTYIDAGDVRIQPGVTEKNVLDWQIKLNVQRRHLNVQQKADLARKLQAQRRWSQKRIADAFGVTRPAVSHWLAVTEPADDFEPGGDYEPGYVVGVDGKEYPTTDPTPEREPRVPPHPWSKKGSAYKSAVKFVKLLQNTSNPNGLDTWQLSKIKTLMEDVISASENVVAAAAEKLEGEKVVRWDDEQDED